MIRDSNENKLRYKKYASILVRENVDVLSAAEVLSCSRAERLEEGEAETSEATKQQMAGLNLGIRAPLIGVCLKDTRF